MRTALLFAAALLAGCTVSPERRPWMEAGFAYDVQETVGSNPACIVRVRAPLHFGPIPPGGLVLGYQHISSCPDVFDKNTVDAVEIMGVFKLGREK